MKKTVSLFLALALCLGLSIPAFADSAPFADVPAGHWACSYVQRAYADGIVEGTSYNAKTGVRLFSPDDALTAAQFTVILARAFYADEVCTKTAVNWYNCQYEVLQSHNIYSGLGTVNLSAPISRYELAQMICNVMRDRGASMPSASQLAAAQAKVSDWSVIPQQYRDAVAAMYCMGILEGMDGGRFEGASSLTRGQAAAVYCRMANALSNAGGGSQNNSQSDSASTAPSTSSTPSASGSSDLDAARQEVLRLVNQERAAQGLSALRLDEAACQAAQVRAAEIIQVFDHTRPDGTSCFTALAQAGASYRRAGENIAYGYQTPAAVMTGWMNSSGHRANILNGSFTAIGIGMVRAGNGQLYWTQMFIG